MPKFTQLPADTFKQLQLNAGVLLKNFDAKSGTITPTDLLGATSGGVKFAATPSYVDFGEDIDNCPKNTKELKRLESYEVVMSGSFVALTPASAKSLAGAADVASDDPTKVVPRNDLKNTDFEDLWWVGDYGDVDGGYIAIHMTNSLSTGGFSLQTTDKEKGKFDFEYTAHYSMADMSKVPFEIFVKAGGE